MVSGFRAARQAPRPGLTARTGDAEDDPPPTRWTGGSELDKWLCPTPCLACAASCFGARYPQVGGLWKQPHAAEALAGSGQSTQRYAIH